MRTTTTGRHAAPAGIKQKIMPAAAVATAASVISTSALLSTAHASPAHHVKPAEHARPVASTSQALEMSAAKRAMTSAARLTSRVTLRKRTYTVQPGDTLSGIAQADFRDASKWPAIWHANGARITNPDLIYPGEVIDIPASAGFVSPPSPVKSSATDGDGDHDHDTSDAPAHSQSSAGNPSPAPAGYYDPSNAVLSESQIERLWVSAGGPSWAEYAAYRVTQCESGGNRYAYNPSGATGLWQILGQVTLFGRPLTDAWVNAKNAVSKFLASGATWAQWVCRP